jgi:hypothetical protein
MNSLRDDKISLLFLKLPAEEIVTLKFLLESYEGLGELRTLDCERGEVVILAIPDTVADLRAMLNSVKEMLKFREIPEPSSLEGDWLLAGSS